MTRVVVLVTSPRVAVGLLSGPAWSALRAGPVFVDDSDSVVISELTAAGIDVRSVGDARSAAAWANEVLAAADVAGAATWWVGPDEGRLASATAALADEDRPPPADQVDVIHGSWDLPGARLLDVVATMDRLRSPGGCPWDAEQDHVSLAPYLLEEAYEAFQTIEDGDDDGLREELGDVLLQVAFHARMAEELPDDARWSIDDVADGLVAKLVRRHPHVFGGVDVTGADEVNVNWEAIKAAERGTRSPLASVALAAPALTLAATLQRKAERSGLTSTADGATLEARLRAALAEFETSASVASAGDALWALVARMRDLGIDPEAALRATARAFRDRLDA